MRLAFIKGALKKMFKFLKQIDELERVAIERNTEVIALRKALKQLTEVTNGLQNQINELKPKKKTK